MQDVADTVSEEWRAVLELAEAADGQTFREAGGDSVTALRLKAAVEGRLGIDFPVELLFSAAGLATITEACQERCRAARPAARRAAAMGEGSPPQWRATGLGDLPPAVDRLLGAASEMVIAGRLAEPARLPAVVHANVCIGRSLGRADLLPASVAWEAAVACAIARALGAGVELVVCLYEEQRQQPEHAAAYADLSARLASALPYLAEPAAVPVGVFVGTRAPAMPPPPDDQLFGLFSPFAESTYPRGLPNERDVLDAFAAYCGRYREAAERHPAAWFAEGVHLVKAAMLGLPPDAGYLAAAALPDPDGHRRLVQDVPPRIRVNLDRIGALPRDWWPELALERGLGVGLREFGLVLADHLGITQQAGGR